MASLDFPRIRELIRLVEAKLSSLPAFDYNNRGPYDAALARIVSELAAEGAKTKSDFNGASFSLSGVRSTSTGGLRAAMSNWTEAARRKLREARP
jgi:hypothetical protein